MANLAERLLICSLVAALTGLLVYGFSVSLVPLESNALLSTFSEDEAQAVRKVIGNLEEGNLNPDGFFNYGYLLYSVAYGGLKVAETLGAELTYSNVALSLRVSILLSYGLVVLGFFWMSGRCGLRAAPSLLLAVYFACSPRLYFWAFHIHPDVVQLPFLILSILLALEEGSLKRYAIIGFLMGCAVSTKLSAILIAPFFFLLEGFRCFETSKLEALKGFLKRFLTASAAGSLTFAAWNPYAVLDPAGLLRDWLFEARHIARGHGRAESGNSLEWVGILWAEFGVLMWIWSVFVVASIVLIRSSAPFFNTRRVQSGMARRDFVLRGFVASIGTVILVCIYLLAGVEMRRARYLFPLYPLLFLGMATSISIVLQELKRFWGDKSSGGPNAMWVGLVGSGRAYGVAILILMALALPRMVARGGDTADAYVKYTEKPILKLGEVLEEVADHSAVLVAGVYSFVPEVFHNQEKTWKFTEELVDSADYLVLNHSVPGRHIWPIVPGDFSGLSKGPFDISAAQYALLLPVFRQDGWTLIYSVEDAYLFERTRSLD